VLLDKAATPCLQGRIFFLFIVFRPPLGIVIEQKNQGVYSEWHLLKLLGMAIFPDVLSGDRTGLDE